MSAEVGGCAELGSAAHAPDGGSSVFILSPVKHMIARLFPLHYVIEKSVNLIIPEYEE